MFDEKFIEVGTISSVCNGFAEIILADQGNCRECLAKIVCRNNDSGGRTLSVENTFGGMEGDRVRISVRGSRILEAAFLLYGFPVFLVVFGAAAGMMIFKDELISSLAGFALAGLFFLILFVASRSKKHDSILKTEILPPVN